MRRILILILLFLFLTSSTYADLATGLVGWWKFDEGTGTSAFDSSGTATTGTLYNSPSWVSGKIGSSALSFVRTSSQYVMAPRLSYNFSTFSVSMWFKTTNASLELSLFSLDDSTYITDQKPIGIFLNIESNGKFQIGIRTVASSTFYGGSGGSAYNNGNWHQVVFTRNGTSGKCYVDGVSNFSFTFGDASNIAITGNYQIGVYYNGNGGYIEYFNGSIDDVRFYNVELSPTNVAQLYSYRGKTGFFVLNNRK